MKILLLEDELMLSISIQKHLISFGCLVDIYDNGSDVLKAIEKQYDLYILDINTPLVSGIECLKVIANKYPNVPKIIISACDDIDCISNAFKLGCKDYLKKPFNIKELQIRIKNLTSNIEEKNFAQNESIINLSKNYKFDTKSHQLYYEHIAQNFTKKEHSLILLFISNIGQIITDETIESFVWDGKYVESSTIRSLVNRVRSKLKEDIIENVRGFGYLMKKRE